MRREAAQVSRSRRRREVATSSQPRDTASIRFPSPRHEQQRAEAEHRHEQGRAVAEPKLIGRACRNYECHGSTDPIVTDHGQRKRSAEQHKRPGRERVPRAEGVEWADPVRDLADEEQGQ